MVPALLSLGPWAGLVLLSVWTRELSPWWLLPVTPLVLLGTVGPGRPSRAGAVGALLLLAATATGFAGHRQLSLLSRDWDGYWGTREARVFDELTEQLDGLLARGEAAVAELARVADRPGESSPPRRVEELLRSTGFPLAAVYAPDGEPVVWAGAHRGKVHEDARLGRERYVYGEFPLFSHLYFTAPIPSTGGTAVIAALLRADLPDGEYRIAVYLRPVDGPVVEIDAGTTDLAIPR